MRSASLAIIAAVCAATGTLAAAAERTGQEIVKAQCSNCHETGRFGAPRIDDRAAWIPRMKKGLDATVAQAIKGHGKMPARGGLADLTDKELRSAVVYMFNTAGPPPKPAPAAPLVSNEKVIDGTEIYLGVKQVKDDVYHVNITLRDDKTHEFIKDAQVEVKVANPVMGAESKKLNREAIDKTVSYGNDFRLQGPYPHVINVEVRRPGRAAAIETKFDLKE